MEQKFNKETLCVQAGWTPKKENLVYCLFIKVQRLSMIPVNRWLVFSIWKTAAILYSLAEPDE